MGVFSSLEFSFSNSGGAPFPMFDCVSRVCDVKLGADDVCSLFNTSFNHDEFPFPLPLLFPEELDIDGIRYELFNPDVRVLAYLLTVWLNDWWNNGDNGDTMLEVKDAQLL